MVKTLVEQVFMPILAALGTAIAGWLAIALLRLIDRVSKKAGVQLSDEQRRAFQTGAERAVLAAEEWGAKQVADKVLLLAEAKYQRALAGMKQMFPSISDADAELHIHAALPELSLGAAAVAPVPQTIRTDAGFAMPSVIWCLLALSAFVFLAVSCMGCLCVPQKGKVDGESCAYQVLTAFDAAVGTVARVSRTELRKCGDTALALRADAQKMKSDTAAYEAKLKESIAKSDECKGRQEIIERVVVGAEDGTQAAADDIPVAVAAAAKDWNAVFEPAKKALADLVKAVADQKVAVPPAVLVLLGVK